MSLDWLSALSSLPPQRTFTSSPSFSFCFLSSSSSSSSSLTSSFLYLLFDFNYFFDQISLSYRNEGENHLSLSLSLSLFSVRWPAWKNHESSFLFFSLFSMLIYLFCWKTCFFFMIQWVWLASVDLVIFSMILIYNKVYMSLFCCRKLGWNWVYTMTKPRKKPWRQPPVFQVYNLIICFLLYGH
jgi:hypothetical protein